MKVLIIDRSDLWVGQGKKCLEKAGHEVFGLTNLGTADFADGAMSESLLETIKKVDAVIVGVEFDNGISSKRFMCVLRHHFPRLPLFWWWLDYGNWVTKYVSALRISYLYKPTIRHQYKFSEKLEAAVSFQKIILSEPLDVYKARDDESGVEDLQRKKGRDLHRRWIEEIARLGSDMDGVDFNGRGKICGMEGGIDLLIMKRLQQCISSGVLVAEDIRPHLSDLRKVLEKLRSERLNAGWFAPCFNFIMCGKLEELELYKGIKELV